MLTWLLPISFLFADRSERSRNPLRLLLAVALGLLVTAWPAQYLYENGPRSYLIFLLPAFFLPTVLLFAGSPGALWVTEASKAQLVQIDPATNAVVKRVPTDRTPCELKYAAGQIRRASQVVAKYQILGVDDRLLKFQIAG